MGVCETSFGTKMGKGRDGIGMLKYGILETMGMLVTHKHVVHFSSQMLHLIIAICPTFCLAPIPNFFFLG